MKTSEKSNKKANKTSPEFERFREITRCILAVPKKEIKQ